MKVKGITPILNVSDVPARMRWFEAIGWRRSFSWNDGGMIEAAADSNATGPAQFAGLCAESDQTPHGPMLFLCKDGQGGRDPRPMLDTSSDSYGEVWMSWWVDDVDAAHREVLKVGVEVVRQPVNEPWGVREFLIRHPHGHYFRVSGPVRKA